MLPYCKPSYKVVKGFPTKWEFHPRTCELCATGQALTNAWLCVSTSCCCIQHQYLSTKLGTVDLKKPKSNQFDPVVNLIVKFVSPVFHPMVMNDTTCLQRFFCMWSPCNASSIYCFSFWILWSVNSTSVNICYNEIVEQQLLDTHTLQPLFLDTSTSNPAPINMSKLTDQVWGVIFSSMFTELINL